MLNLLSPELKMSEALLDEIEAINSIYGENTLTPDRDEYILTLPLESAPSLRLQFPDSYPDVPPTILGTHSISFSLKPGAANRDLSLFRDAVSEVYEPGQVCLFDSIEKFQELYQSHSQQPESDCEGETTINPQRSSTPPPPPELSSPPPWTLSLPHTELKSTFLARTCHVTSPSQAKSFLSHLFSTDKRTRQATHNITAWRIRGPNSTSFQDCDDDGETAAGGRLLHLMQLMDLWDTMVVVTRWYGGQKLGPRRFAVINMVARDAFVRAGLVDVEGGGEGKGRKKGGK
ncbi:ribosomal protein S5 domain 2-type protein [Podospora fimiseda]|uniref:Ribosomal protein S5 domain 2-type protein n=1 Tax=Podospora fimiseda TaxID=252190 RepID=A0AAN7BM66_9PEZI|nr:ribosomal protein S5 domain 2-type protein [Podospora fimiseda]